MFSRRPDRSPKSSPHYGAYFARASVLYSTLKLFIQVSNWRNGPNVLDVRDERMRLLSEDPWPGNVRQLANIAEQMFVLTQND